MKKQLEKNDVENFIPLMPQEVLDEYKDFINPDLRCVIRANCLRRYVEGIVDLFFKQKICAMANISLEQWNKTSLHKRILLIGKYYDKNFMEQLLKIKSIGNEGSHFGNEIDQNDIQNSIMLANHLVEQVLVKYFIDNPLGTQLPVMTILSLLPPLYRVNILEQVWKRGERNNWLVDKLSMAYLKSGKYEDSINFLQQAFNEKVIDSSELNDFNKKIDMMQSQISHIINITSKNLIDTKSIFNRIIKDENLSKYEEFINIFVALLAGYNNSPKEETKL